MKKMRYVIVLVSIVLMTSGIFLWYTINVSENAARQVGEIQSLVLSGKKNSAKEKANFLDEYWQNHQPILSMAIHHDTLQQIEEPIKLMRTSLNQLQEQEVNSDFWISSAQAELNLNNLSKSELPSPENIL